MFETMREPPVRGSLQESLLILYVTRRDHIQFVRDQAFAVGQVSPKDVAEAMDIYRKALFPWAEKSKTKDHDDDIKKLLSAVKGGPLVITAQQQKPLKSRMRAKIIDADQFKAGNQRAGRLYDKLGRIIPLK